MVRRVVHPVLVLPVVLAFAGTSAWAQQSVFSRGEVGTSLWENNSDKPWYYQTWNSTESRPDINGDRNNVFFGHNNNLNQDVNSNNWYTLRSLTIQSSASSNRSFTASGNAGISLTVGLTNQSAGAMTFNVPFGIDAPSVSFSNGGGTVSATRSVFLNSNTLAFSGTGSFDVSGVVQGSGGSITKSGSGTLTLSTANTYTGSTTVEQGTLSLATVGSINNSALIDVQAGAILDVSDRFSSFTVQGGQTLRGNGTVLGYTLVAGTVSPGAAGTAGKLTIGTDGAGSSSTPVLGLLDGSSINLDVDGTARGVAGGYDAIDIGSSLSYEGTLSLDFASAFPDGTSFDLFDFSGEGGNFDAINLTGSYSGSLSPVGITGWAGTFGSQVITFTNSTGVLSLSAQAVPEPLTAAGVILLAGRVLGRRSRLSL